ncbi:hypothetical protein EWM60_20060 [Candidatus Erwinia dacicola]|nr:hypothetical protein [Candidatus Erwinia dacicola]
MALTILPNLHHVLRLYPDLLGVFRSALSPLSIIKLLSLLMKLVQESAKTGVIGWLEITLEVLVFCESSLANFSSNGESR